MSITYGRFFAPQQIPAADTPIFTVPSNQAQTVMKSFRVRLANTTAAAANVTLYAAIGAAAGSAANTCLPAVSIAANDYLDVDVPDMAAGDTLRALGGTANAITISQLDGFLKA
jgi:hypothetical protein